MSALTDPKELCKRDLHQYRMISSEVLYEYKWSSEPYEHRYSYQCRHCGKLKVVVFKLIVNEQV